MRDQQTCIECGKLSPETETNYTLISAQFGWRLTRRKDDNGMFIVEWRCPECWRDHKDKVGDSNTNTVKLGPGSTTMPAVTISTKGGPPKPPPPLPSRASKADPKKPAR
jgi:hypothetical protein